MNRWPQFKLALLTNILVLIALVCDGQIRDGGIDPSNLGKGDWIYSIQDATNKLGGHITSVTNENSLMLFYKSQGIRYVIVKTGTGASLYNACYGFPQLTTSFINTAHTNGIWVFGYNRSFATNVAGEVAIADFVFNQGADGFVWDAEAEWESTVPGVGANGPSLAWQQCSTVRSNWPNKFLAHAPFPIIYFHSSFPYKEFGYWCDAVMPQIYHLSSAGLKSSPSATINWSDVNWATWQSSLYSLPATNINGLTVYWTNSIKPILPLQDVYATTGGGFCNSASTAVPDEDVTEFIDYSAADPNAQTSGGYKGINFWRADLHGAVQWANIKAGKSGTIPGVVNNIVMDDANATVVGGWTAVKVFGATTTLPTYYGATGSDTNSFGTNYYSKAQGAGSAYVQFTPSILVAGDYDLYQWHPYVTNASSGVPHVITYTGGTATVNANQQTNSGNWTLLGRFNFATGTNGNIRVLDNFPDAGNVTVADGIQLVFITATSAPIIGTPPQSQTVAAGQDATFSVLATGSTPLSYQWRFNNVNLVNATNTAYTRAAAQTNHAGNYLVVVSNYLGSVTSAPAVLTVNYALTLTVIGSGSIFRSPITTNYSPGTTVTLTAQPAGGYDFTGWSGDLSGTNNPISLFMATNQFVTATFVSTQTDIILDNPDPLVTYTGSWTAGTSSTDKYLTNYVFATSGASVTATATYRPVISASGYYDVYIWYPQGGNRANNAPWLVSYDGGSTNVLVNQQANGGGWRLIAGARPFLSGTNGFVRLSNNANISVVLADGVRFTYVGPLNTLPLITTQPTSLTVKVSSNATFIVVATGTPPPTYQWRFNNIPLANATNSTYTRFNAQTNDSGNYSVILTNLAGSVLSSNAVLMVLPPVPLQIQSITRLLDGRMQLVISGESNAPVWIDRAPGLPPGWLEQTNLFNTTGTIQFTDDSATNLNQGYYRARQ